MEWSGAWEGAHRRNGPAGRGSFLRKGIQSDLKVKGNWAEEGWEGRWVCARGLRMGLVGRWE